MSVLLGAEEGNYMSTKSIKLSTRLSNSTSAWRLLYTLTLLGAAACASAADSESTPQEDVGRVESPLTTSSGPTDTWRVTSQFISRQTLIDVLTALDDQNTPIDAMATAPNGSWVIVSGGARWYSDSFPSAARTAIEGYITGGQRIVAVDFNSASGWVVVTSTTQSYGGSVPQSVRDKISEYRTNRRTIEDVDITTTGYVVVGSGSLVSYSSIDNDLASVFADRLVSKRKVRQVDIGFDGRWAVVSDQAPATEGASSQFTERLETMAREGWVPSRFMFGLSDNYVVYSHGRPQPSATSPIEAIEYDVGGRNIWQAMQEANVPGLSLAIVDGNQVTYARGYGRRRADEPRAVLTSTRFDLASLSKYAAALGVMRVDEDSTVNLSLSTDARSVALNQTPFNALYAWKLAMESDPAAYGWPDAVPLPSGLTLRRLLSHTASMQPHSTTGIPVSYWRTPSLSQLLLGFDCLSSSGCGYYGSRTVWYDPALGAPGTSSDYSGGGFLVAQAVAEERTQMEFEQLMQARVFTPLGLNDLVYVTSPPSSSLEATLAVQHDSAPRERSIYPWASGGGLYGSARDYARILIPLLNQGRSDIDTQFLSAASTSQMLTDQGGDSDDNYGLGLGLDRSAVTETSGTFSHNGSHGGRAYSYMEGRPNRNQALVVIVNTESDAARQLVSQIITSYRCAYGITSC
ncbi:MAG: serine hydrolase domain-containing protein [Myxococcota bacterium]